MRLRIAIVAVVLVAAVGVSIAFFATHTPSEPAYQGRSARAWLDRMFSPPPEKSLAESRNEVFRAFQAMGTNAYPFLLAALAAKETPFQKAYRIFYAKLPWKIVPSAILRRLPRPTYVENLRDNAFDVLLQLYPKPPVADLLALANTGAHSRVFLIVSSYIGPSDTNQIPLLISACHDTDSGVRQGAVTCLGAIGPAASNSVPALASVCTDTNLLTRGAAALALYHVTGRTNEAAQVLKDIIAQTRDATPLYNASISLVMMTNSIPLATTTLTALLTNVPQVWVRGPASAWLGIIGPPASNAVPLLRLLLKDPDWYVRDEATRALARIQPTAETKNTK